MSIYGIVQNKVNARHQSPQGCVKVGRGSLVWVGAELYMVVRTGGENFALCSLENGNRYSVTRQNIYALVEDALGRLPRECDVVQEGETITITVGKCT